MPWNHRADILAQIYLKPSTKGKKCHKIVSSEFIIKNFTLIPKEILIVYLIFGSNIGGTLSDQNLFAVLDPISQLSFFPSHFDRGELFESLRARTLSDQNFGQSQASINWSLRARALSDQNFKLFELYLLNNVNSRPHAS
jgi:hypothetical protein